MDIGQSLTPSFLLRLRITVYATLIFFSFFIFIGSAVMKDDYGVCPLYADAVDDPGPDSNCNYPIAIAVIFQLVYLLFRLGLITLVAVGKLEPDSTFFSDTFEFAYVVTDLLAFFLTFVAACVLSAGRNDACDECDRLGDWHSSSDAAQAGAWISTFLWLFIGVCGLLCAIRDGRTPCMRGESPQSGASASRSGGGGTPNNVFESRPYQDPLGF